MDNIKLSIFDIFSYIVPGIVYFFLAYYSVNYINFDLLFVFLQNLSISSIFVYGFISYLIGFSMDTIAAGTMEVLEYFFGDFNVFIIEGFKKQNQKCFIDNYHFSEIYSYADLKAPQIREKTDQYSAMSGLARNLSLAFLLFVVVNIFYETFFSSSHDWPQLIMRWVAGTGISFVLMLKAYIFRKWSHYHLLHIYHMLHKEKIISS